MVKKLLSAVLAAGLVTTLAATPAWADRREKAENMVADAAETVAYFASDPAYEPLWNAAGDAKAMVIIPKSFRAGFIFGASGGNAVMVARNDDGSWSQPTFKTIGSASFGFQIGGEMSETILLAMTRRGMEHLLSTTVKLGGDVTLAAGPIGAGAKAQTTDILAFSRSRGLYGGLSLEGAVLKSRNNLNKAYYGADVSPADIIYREQAYNPASAQLQNAAWALAHRNAPATLAPVRPIQAANANPVFNPPAENAQANGAPVYAPGAGAPEYEDDAAWGAPIGKSD